MQIILLLFAVVLVLSWQPGLSRRTRSRCRQALSSLVLLLFSTSPGRDRQSATSGAMNLRHVVRPFWRRFASRRKNWSGRWRHDDVNSMPAAGAGYADFLPERTWLPANQSGGGNHAGIPFSECSGGASSRTGEKRRHHDKAWRGPGDNASYRSEGRRQRGGLDYPLTACR